jgi:DNA-binding transcriptional MerR regulator
MEKAPDAFRTISEVADDLDIPQHVLRFWESRFAQVKPMKRGGGRRYYRPDDVDLLRGIRHLLYGQGYTIRGVQRILREQGVRFVQTVWEEGAEQPLPSEEDAEAVIETAEETAETGADVPGRLPRTNPVVGPRGPAPRSERREPTFAVQGDDGATRPHGGALTPADRQILRAALTELAECRRVLDAAMDQAS